MTRSIGSLSFRRRIGAKLLALDEGHGDELDAVDLAEFVDADHVLVGDLARQQELLLETALEHRRRRRVRGHLWPNHLERDDDAELGVPRLIHSAHAADAEQADDVIARAEWLSGRKGPVGDGSWPARLGRGPLASVVAASRSSAGRVTVSAEKKPEPVGALG